MNKLKTFLLCSALCAGSTLLAMDNLSELDKKLIDAARAGNTRSVRRLIKKGASLGATVAYASDKNGWTALAHASYYGNTEVVELLIKNKASECIDWKDSNGLTSLMLATIEDHKNTAQLLIENNASIHAQSTYGLTALGIAIKHGRIDTGKLLLEHKAAISIDANYNRRPLIEYINNPCFKSSCKTLAHALLVDVKAHQKTAIALLGIRKYREVPCLHLIGKEVIKLITRPAFEYEKKKFLKQINAIIDVETKAELAAQYQIQLKSEYKNNNACTIF